MGIPCTRAVCVFSFNFAWGRDVKSACTCLLGSVRRNVKYVHEMSSQLHAPHDSESLYEATQESILVY